METISYQLAVFALARRLQKLFRTRCPQRAAKLGQLAALSDQIGKTMVLLSPVAAVQRVSARADARDTDPFPDFAVPQSGADFDAERAKTQALFEQIGEIDAAQAILSYRHSLPLWTTPVFEEKLSIRAESLLHPLLTESDCVPNDAQIEANWLLTGSNASGKSTFIKAVALNAILAQSIHTCNRVPVCAVQSGGCPPRWPRGTICRRGELFCGGDQVDATGGGAGRRRDAILLLYRRGAQGHQHRRADRRLLRGAAIPVPARLPMRGGNS